MVPKRLGNKKQICLKCGFKKIIPLRTFGCTNMIEYYIQFLDKCPKCGSKLETKDLNVLDKVVYNIFK